MYLLTHSSSHVVDVVDVVDVRSKEFEISRFAFLMLFLFDSFSASEFFLFTLSVALSMCFNWQNI